jgi:hypothetical protein
MKNTALVAATLLAFTLAGCAVTADTNGGGNGTAAMATAGKTMYCMDGKLNPLAEGYRCTWAASVKEACEATETTVIAKSAIAAGPVRGGMCSHGDRLVHVTVR